MAEFDFETRLAAFIHRHALIAPGVRMVIGVSGGADSMALFRGLYELSCRMEKGWQLHAAHLNHGLRGGHSEADAEFVREQTKRLGSSCTVESARVSAETKTATGGMEETARLRRYEFLERVCLRKAADVLAVGHHADDNAETILHHIVRGSSWRGLRGMVPSRPLRPDSRVTLVRPLLGIRRAQVMDYVESLGIPYRQDASNDCLDHTRNRIRHTIMPMLSEQLNPQAADALLRLGEQARWTEEFVADVARRALEAATSDRTDERMTLTRHGLAGRPRIVQLEIVRQAAASFGIGERDLSFAHLVSLVDLLESQQGSGVIELPGGLTVQRKAEHVVFNTVAPNDAGPPLPEVVVSVPGVTAIPGTAWVVETELVPAPSASGPPAGRAIPNQEIMDYDRLDSPLVVRGIRPGDRFVPLGAPGHKRVSEFFIDHKVPPDIRPRTPILCDQHGPLWVIPIRLDERAKVTEHTTRFLRVTVRS